MCQPLKSFGMTRREAVSSLPLPLIGTDAPLRNLFSMEGASSACQTGDGRPRAPKNKLPNPDLDSGNLYLALL